MKITKHKILAMLATAATATALTATGITAPAAPAAASTRTAAQPATAPPVSVPKDALLIKFKRVSLPIMQLPDRERAAAYQYWGVVQWQNRSWCVADPWDSTGQPGHAGTKVVLWQCQPGNAWFLWSFNKILSGQYTGWSNLQNYMSLVPGYGYLVLDNYAGLDNTRLQVWNWVGNGNQVWKYKTDSNGFLLLYNPHGEYMAMPFVAKNGAWVITLKYSPPTYGRGLDWYCLACLPASDRRLEDAPEPRHQAGLTGRRGATMKPKTAGPPTWLQWASLILAVTGLGLAAYETYAHFTASPLAGCTATGGCTAVTTSPQSVLFGVFPVAVLGLAFYLVVTGLMTPWAWRAQRREVGLLRLAAMVTGMGFVMYLIYAEVAQIREVCEYCTGVHVITFLLFCITVLAAAAWGIRAKAARGRTASGARRAASRPRATSAPPRGRQGSRHR